MAKTLAPAVLVTATAKPAATPTRGIWDVSSADGGMLTCAITNGVTGPTAQCVVRIMVAHKQTSMPAAGAEGSGNGDWKVVAQYGGGIVAAARNTWAYRFGPEVAYIQAEFSTHTGNDVTVEALGTSFVY